MQKILNSSKNICAAGTGTWAGWSSDTWGSYLVVVSPAGDKLYENFYGTKVGMMMMMMMMMIVMMIYRTVTTLGSG